MLSTKICKCCNCTKIVRLTANVLVDCIYRYLPIYYVKVSNSKFHSNLKCCNKNNKPTYSILNCNYYYVLFISV